MPLSNDPLWCRLQALPIGADDAALGFADRLARDNAWPIGFAHRVIEEYRRFLYLCCVARHPVTPSDEVDEAWHLHLTYTRSYWEGLCRDVLGRSLHHTPTAGGPEERQKYDAQYRATLYAYAKTFGEPPPADIWPAPLVRFGRCRVRVDRDSVWMIEKRTVRAAGTAAVGSLALALFLSACARIYNESGSLSWLGEGLVLLGTGVVAYVIGRWLWRLDRKRGNDAGGCGSGCGDSGCGGGCS